MKYFSRHITGLLFASIPVLVTSQDLGDCQRNDVTIDQILRLCKNITEDKNKTDREIALAARRVGLMLQIDKKGSPEEIIGYLLLSAKKGHGASFSHIGNIYREGYKSLKPDYEKALYYFRQDGSVSTAGLVGIGEMFFNGQGVERSIERAISNFQMAAFLDDDDSIIRQRLCGIYYSGKHIEKDLVKAHFWCSSAVDAESYPPLKGMREKDRLDIELQMNKSQLLESNRMMKECKKSGLLQCLKL